MFEKLKRVSLELSHNPHVIFYDSVEDYIGHDVAQITPNDCQEILEKQEIWELTWYPDTPVGHCTIAAASLERIHQLVDEMTKDK
jgi:hypothetical protein